MKTRKQLVFALGFIAFNVAASRAHAACPYSANQIVVYTGYNFTGGCSVLTVGQYANSTQMAISNDKISSLQVGSNVRASLFENASFGGREAFFDGGYHYAQVGDEMNDKTSSIIVLNRWGTPAAFWYLGNKPNEMTAPWTDNVNGIASDNYNSWLITNADQIFKFPITNISNNNYTRMAVMPQVLRDRGCNHYGDPDAANGYLFVPVTGCQGGPMLAVFRASDLSFVCFDEMFLQSDAGWAAIDPRSGDLVTSDKSINASEPLVIYSVDWDAIYPDPNPHWFLWPAEGTLPTLVNRSGLPVDLKHMQGGDFNEDGTLLYLSNGYYNCEGGADGLGLSIFDTWDYSLVARSGNGYGPFNYEVNCGTLTGEEPEGLDYRDMTGRGANFGGQLHVLLLDNDWNTNGADDAYIKHYEW